MVFNFTRVGIVAFTAVALLGPLYTVQGYDPVQNTISQLGAQQTQNNFIMIAGFVLLGAGLIADGLRFYRGRAIPFIAFGLCMLLAGLLPHRPLDPALAYSASVHQAHGILASLAGLAITIGLLWQAAVKPILPQRVLAVAVAVLCVALPLLMLNYPEYQGAIQRGMYACVFTWLWVFYPQSLALPGNQRA